MCGIAGFVIGPTCRSFAHPLTAEKLADALLIGIMHRGTDATGVLSIGPDGLSHQRAAVDAKKFNLERRPLVANPTAVLLHTRYATQGHEGFIENNHPVEHNGVFVTHNGHISNDSTLFKTVPTPRLARVDSEIIPALLSHADWTPEGVASQLERLDGGYAIAALNPASTDVFIARGNSSPLVYITREGFTMWASERATLKDAWKEVWGTPPADEHFKFAQEGQLFRLRDGSIESVLNFTPMESYYVSRKQWSALGSWPAKKGTVATAMIEEMDLWDKGATEVEDVEMEDAEPERYECADCGADSLTTLADWYVYTEDKTKTDSTTTETYCDHCVTAMLVAGVPDRFELIDNEWSSVMDKYDTKEVEVGTDTGR